MKLKNQISYELNNMPPEYLEQVYMFIQFLKNSNYQSNNVKKTEHFLSDFAGILDDESAKEIKNIINSEFQNIEGEW